MDCSLARLLVRHELHLDCCAFYALPFLCRLLHLQYELLRYDDPDQELAGTDLTELEGGQLPPPAPEGKGGRCDATGGCRAWLGCMVNRCRNRHAKGMVHMRGALRDKGAAVWQVCKAATDVFGNVGN